MGSHRSDVRAVGIRGRVWHSRREHYANLLKGLSDRKGRVGGAKDGPDALRRDPALLQNDCKMSELEFNLPRSRPTWPCILGNLGYETHNRGQGGHMTRGNKLTFSGDATNNVVVVGNMNNTNAHLAYNVTRSDLPAADTVDIQAELAVLRKLLTNLAGEDRPLVDAAVTEATVLAGKPAPPRDQIANALARAAGYAGDTKKLIENGTELWPVIKRIGGWLGESGTTLLKLAGVALV